MSFTTEEVAWAFLMDMTLNRGTIQVAAAPTVYRRRLTDEQKEHRRIVEKNRRARAAAYKQNTELIAAAYGWQRSGGKFRYVGRPQ